MKSIIIIFILLFSSVFNIRSASPEVKVCHVLDIHAKCGKAIYSGDVPNGTRIIIPITGGYVEGKIEGNIISGGADYQLIDTVSGRCELDAIYTIKTQDSNYINVRNIGISISDTCCSYFVTTPRFEAPKKSKYNWINDRIFICRPIGFGDGMVHLRVWEVE